MAQVAEHFLGKEEVTSSNLVSSSKKSHRMHLLNVTFSDGVYGDEVPPVPIPNTEVKLIHVDNTWLATVREDSSMPSFFADLAHLVERHLAKVEVASSSLVIRSKSKVP